MFPLLPLLFTTTAAALAQLSRPFTLFLAYCYCCFYVSSTFPFFCPFFFFCYRYYYFYCHSLSSLPLLLLLLFLLLMYSGFFPFLLLLLSLLPIYVALFLSPVLLLFSSTASMLIYLFLLFSRSTACATVSAAHLPLFVSSSASSLYHCCCFSCSPISSSLPLLLRLILVLLLFCFSTVPIFRLFFSSCHWYHCFCCFPFPLFSCLYFFHLSILMLPCLYFSSTSSLPLLTKQPTTLPQRNTLIIIITATTTTIIIIIIIIVIIIIIIAFKGAIRDFFESPHSAANCLQHVRSNGPGAIVCKSRATHRALITHKCHVTCHLVRRDSSAIKFDELNSDLFELYFTG